MKTCANCIYFMPFTGELHRDRFGDEHSSLCVMVREYASESDEACDYFESDAEGDESDR